MDNNIFEFKNLDGCKDRYKYRITKIYDDDSTTHLLSNNFEKLIEEGNKRWNTFAIHGNINKEMEEL